MSKKTALLVSRAGEPMFLLTALALVAGYHAGLRGLVYALYLSIVFIVMVLPPAWYRLKLVASHQTDWDVTDRKKRMKPLLFQTVFLLLDIYLISLFRVPALTHVYFALFFWLAGFVVITTVWKISGHAATVALLTGIVVFWYGTSWWPVLLGVPILGWARVKHKDHTMAQVIAGALYSWVMIVLFFR